MPPWAHTTPDHGAVHGGRCLRQDRGMRCGSGRVAANMTVGRARLSMTRVRPSGRGRFGRAQLSRGRPACDAPRLPRASRSSHLSHSNPACPTSIPLIPANPSYPAQIPLISASPTCPGESHLSRSNPTSRLSRIPPIPLESHLVPANPTCPARIPLIPANPAYPGESHLSRSNPTCPGVPPRYSSSRTATPGSMVAGATGLR